MNREKRNRKIEKYLNKELLGIARNRFESQVEKDEKLASELKLEMELREALNEQSDYNIYKRIVDQTSEKYFNEVERPITIFTPLRIAASISLLITASFAVWWIVRTQSPDQIYDQYFEPYTIQTTPRGLIEDGDSYMMGTIFYRDMEYDSAKKRFEAVLNESPEDYRAMLMLGISFMALKDFDNAEKILLLLVNDPNHLFQDQARWYLGLLYLSDKNDGNDGKAEEYFEKIEERKLRKNARDLLD